MIDIQSQPDDRDFPIDDVGVHGIRHPIVVLDRARERQHTIAMIAMSVSLPRHFKGTHMSRFLEVLHAHEEEMTFRTLPSLLDTLRDRLEADTARLEVAFPYFMTRIAPATGARSLMDYACTLIGEHSGGREAYTIRVVVPVTSLCPCSKAISEYGAHNQRGWITIEVSLRGRAPDDLVWIEELIEIGEASGSAPIYPLLKRPDERFVTMQAYENPVFGEDMVRNVAVRLRGDERIVRFRVHADNDESIHLHNAFAEIRWQRV